MIVEQVVVQLLPTRGRHAANAVSNFLTGHLAVGRETNPAFCGPIGARTVDTELHLDSYWMLRIPTGVRKAEFKFTIISNNKVSVEFPVVHS